MKCPFCVKICNKCKRILVAYEGNFYRRERGKYGFRAECKKCRKEKQSKYFKDHKEERLKYNKEYYRNNSDKVKLQTKTYKENHKENHQRYNKEYREKHKEELLEYTREWRRNNESKTFEYNINRRIKEDKQGRGITDEQFLEMMNFFNWSCAYSGIQFSSNNKNKDRSIDHIVPINKNGSNEPWNCVPMYMSYNSSKNDNDMLEWYKKQDYFDNERLLKIYEWQQYAKEKWG